MRPCLCETVCSKMTAVCRIYYSAFKVKKKNQHTLGELSGKCLDLKVNNAFKWQCPRKIRVDEYNIIFSQPFKNSDLNSKYTTRGTPALKLQTFCSVKHLSLLTNGFFFFFTFG